MYLIGSLYRRSYSRWFSHCTLAICSLACARRLSRSSWKCFTISPLIVSCSWASSGLLIFVPNNSSKGDVPMERWQVPFIARCTRLRCLYHLSGSSVLILLMTPLTMAFTLSTCPFPLGTPAVMVRCAPLLLDGIR